MNTGLVSLINVPKASATLVKNNSIRKSNTILTYAKFLRVWELQEKKRHGFCFISKLQLKFLRTYKRLWFFLSRTRKKNYNFLMKVIWNSFSSSLALGSWWSNFTKSAMDSDFSQLWNSYFSVITGYIAPPWNSTKIIKLWQTFGVVFLLICFFALH